MAYYFKEFPTATYRNEVLTDLSLRYKLKSNLKQYSTSFVQYEIQEGERPDNIAFGYYDDASLDWIILITNDIINVKSQWPLTSKQLDNYVKQKYGSVSSAQATVHHYEQVLQAAGVGLEGRIIPEKSVTVSKEVYDGLSPSKRKVVYQYEYETEVNNLKRTINLIDPKYVPAIVNSVKSILK